MKPRRIAAVFAVAILLCSLVAVFAPHSGAASSPGVARASPAGVHVLGPRPLIAAPLTIIYPDGSISNLSAPITVNGLTYTLTAPLLGGLLDERNGSTLNGNVHQVNSTYNPAFAIEVRLAHNVLVENFDVLNASYGIVVASSQKVTVQSNHVASSSSSFAIASSSNVTVTLNTATKTGGLVAQSSSWIAVTHNDLSHSGSWGVVAAYCSHADIAFNQVDFSSQGILVEFGQSAWIWGNNVSNTLDGVAVDYFSQATVDWNNGSFDGYFLFIGNSAQVTEQNDSGRNPTGYGIYSYLSSEVMISGTSIPSATGIAAFVYGGQDVMLSHLQAQNSGTLGINATSVSGLTLLDNNVTGFWDFGIVINGSSSVNLTGNWAPSGSWLTATGLLTFGDSGLWLGQNVFDHNAYGWVDRGSTGVTAWNNSFAYAAVFGGDAVYFSGESQVKFTGNFVYSASILGIYFNSVTGLSIIGNNVSAAGSYAIEVYDATDVTVSGNDASGAYTGGLLAEFVANLEVDNNWFGHLAGTSGASAIVIAYDQNVSLVQNGAGFANNSTFIVYSAGVLVDANNVSNSEVGLHIGGGDINVTFVGNQAWLDTFGFWIDPGASQIAFYHNNFDALTWFNNNSNIPGSVTWDNGYPSGGNFWANHTTPDSFGGANQSVPGADGIVDTPFTLNATNVDHYPLATPWIGITISYFESGLPAGTAWGVTINGVSLSTTSTSLVYNEPDGANVPYVYFLHGVMGYHTASSPNGTYNPRTFYETSLLFSPNAWGIIFHSSGLPTGATWNVSLSPGTTVSSSGNTITFVNETNGTYTYSIQKPSGWAAVPNTGKVILAGSAQSVTIDFSQVTYQLTIVESGLPTGTLWSATVGGTTQNSSTTTISFTEPNGSYTYTILAVSGHSAPTPSTGTALVHGGDTGVPVSFPSVASSTSSGGSYSGTQVGGLLAALIVVGLLAAVGWVLAAKR
ncbi:MAG: right-handed parallel beta-helix repeat-containing protein, partial [Candidatus Lutacidiplasmatales archaeon]